MMTDKEIIEKYRHMDKRQAVTVIADLCGVERLEIIKILESHGITPPGRRPVDLYRRLEQLDHKIKYHDKWKKVWEERYKKVAERINRGQL